MNKVNLFSTICLLLFLITVIGCSPRESPYKKEAEETIKYLSETNHPIRKMQNRVNNIENINVSSYFLFSTTTSIENTSQPVIVFSYIDSISQTYLIVSVPLSRTKIKFLSDSIPSIKFVFKERELSNLFLNYYNGYFLFEGRTGYISPKEVFARTTQAIFDSYLSYMIINCKENDWPTNIELPLNNSAVK